MQKQLDEFKKKKKKNLMGNGPETNPLQRGGSRIFTLRGLGEGMNFARCHRFRLCTKVLTTGTLPTTENKLQRGYFGNAKVPA